MSTAAAQTPGGSIQRTPLTPSPRCCHTGGTAAQVSTDFTNSTPVTTEAYLCEVQIPSHCFVTGIAVFNGTDVTGNIILGLYDSNGVQLVLTAATAGSGTDAYQRVPFTAPLEVQPGTYYVASIYSSGTARYNTHTIGTFGAGKLTSLTTMVLPATAVMPSTFTTALGNVATLY